MIRTIRLASKINNRSILPVRIIIYKNNTWARDRQDYLSRLNNTSIKFRR